MTKLDQRPLPVAPLPSGSHPEPVDGDMARRERIAERAADIRREDAAEELEEPYGDPSKVKDGGILESIGRAITEPVRGATDEDVPQTQPVDPPKR